MNDRKTPRIRFKGFTDDWEQRKFEDITFPAGEKNKDNIAYESYSVTNENGFVPQNEQFENGGTMATANKSMYYIVSRNSFAYNPARINVGSIGYYDKPENVIVSSLYEVFKTIEDIDDRFLWHWFKSNAFQKMIEQYQEGGVRLYFYYDKLCMCSLPIPDIKEQRKIGKQLDEIDHLITLHQRKLEKLKIIKKAMLENCFPKNGEKVPKFRFSGFTGDWEQRKLGEIVGIYDGVHQTPNYQNSGVMFLSVENIATLKSSKFISEEDFKRDYKVFPQEKDILMTRIGDVGTTNVVTDNGLKAYYVSLALLKYKSTDPYFLSNAIQSDYVQKGLANRTLKTAIPMKINKDEIGKVSVMLPLSATEQQQIGTYFRHLDHLITLHQRKLEKLKLIKKSFLEKMFV